MFFMFKKSILFYYALIVSRMNFFTRPLEKAFYKLFSTILIIWKIIILFVSESKMFQIFFQTFNEKLVTRKTFNIKN